MASLNLNGVSKHFGTTHALRDVSLDVRDGEFLVLLGPTAAGKTTTLRCVAGLEKPDSGSILMNGQPIQRLSPAERDVAFVFQTYALYPRKTVFENMAFPLRARRWSQEDIRRHVEEVAAKLRIHTLLGRRPAELSGGQQQRVALGRAIVRQPRAFLMDEPLTNLDFTLRVEMRGELKRLQEELAATFFYVTNDQVEAMSMADRIAVLNKGVIQQVDTPENVYNKPANLFVAGFVGSPRMNILDCRLEGNTLIGKGNHWQVALLPEQREKLHMAKLHTTADGALLFGVRAEDVELSLTAIPGAYPAQVYILEPLGDRTFVDLQLPDGGIIKARAEASFSANEGDTLWISFNPERIHVFDKQTGLAVC